MSIKQLIFVLSLFLGFNLNAKTVEASMDDLWSGLSHAANEAANIAVLDDVFHSTATIYGVRYQQQAANLRVLTRDEFLSSLASVRDTGFYECEIARKITQYDRFATVYSVVESRTDKAQIHPDFTGVNSVQLYKDDDRWRIVSLYYQVEHPSIPIEATLLKRDCK
ncbi:nuclear transport factor 2 family protein [Pseudoalteromonas sp. GB56]